MAVLNPTKTDELMEQLMKIEGKAEIVGGKIKTIMPTGEEPSLASGEIFVSLHLYARRIGRGRAVPDNATFRVDLPNRQSFSPDAAYMTQERSGSMGAIHGAPLFAVEVRSENDYGPAAERAISAKIADYFAAGTRAVWDVDLLSENVVTLHLPQSAPQVFRRGDVAAAGDALPDWTMSVDEIFA